MPNETELFHQTASPVIVLTHKNQYRNIFRVLHVKMYSRYFTFHNAKRYKIRI